MFTSRLTWYLRRPHLYRELLRRARGRAVRAVRGTSETAYRRAHEEAAAWCEAQAVDTATAIARLTDSSSAATPFSERFATELERAKAAAEAAPVSMGGPGNLDLLYALAEHVEARRVIETGVAYGWSALALLLSLRERPDARLISTDMPYVEGGNDEYVGVVVPPELRSQWTLLRHPDRDALPKALRQMPSLDLCHYDSDKTYEGRMWSYGRLWKATREGGFFISDDVSDDLGFHDFCAQVQRQPVIVSSPALLDPDAEAGWTQYVGLIIR